MVKSQQPIVIKKIKKGGHGHHGGAWKVALADFVTAMMAFFLLLWLLSSTSPEQRRGISDYFNDPTVLEIIKRAPVAEETRGASDAIVDMGGGMNTPSSAGQQPDEAFPELDEAAIEAQAAALEQARLQALQQDLLAAIESAPQLRHVKDQLLLDLTSEGLRIQIIDQENRPMFDLGSSGLKDYARDLLEEIARIIATVPNRISISGHTDRTPYLSDDGRSNWELSTERANAARRELVGAGLPEDQVGRIVGLGSSVLFDKENPYNPVNRRISIVIMNKAAEEELSDEQAPQQPPPQ